VAPRGCSSPRACSSVIGFRERRGLSAPAYISGLSYRDTAYVYRLVDASHEAVRQWVLRLEGLMLRVGRRGRRAIALDETVVKVVGAKDWLWSPVDLGNGEVLATPIPLQERG